MRKGIRVECHFRSHLGDFYCSNSKGLPTVLLCSSTQTIQKIRLVSKLYSSLIYHSESLTLMHRMALVNYLLGHLVEFLLIVSVFIIILYAVLVSMASIYINFI